MNGDFALAAIAIPVLTEAYGVLSFNGSRMTKETSALTEQIEPSFERGIYALGAGNLTDIKKGLQYNLPCPKDQQVESSTTLSLLQNARGLWVYNELEDNIAASKLEVILLNSVYTAVKNSVSFTSVLEYKFLGSHQWD